MLIVALVLAVIGLAALVTAVVTSNELVAWVCIAASVIGVILLIVDAIRERQNRQLAEEPESVATAETVAYSETDETVDATYSSFDAEYPDEDVLAESESESEPEPEPEPESEPEDTSAGPADAR
ncbi:hypothetical protein ACXDF8_05545 [Mycolicibacterium sp. CBM1]